MEQSSRGQQDPKGKQEPAGQQDGRPKESDRTERARRVALLVGAVAWTVKRVASLFDQV
jgi:hypothetical protein